MVYDDDYPIWGPPTLLPGAVYTSSYFSSDFLLLIEVVDLDLYPFACSVVSREYSTKTTMLDTPEEVVCLL